MTLPCSNQTIHFARTVCSSESQEECLCSWNFVAGDWRRKLLHAKYVFHHRVVALPEWGKKPCLTGCKCLHCPSETFHTIIPHLWHKSHSQTSSLRAACTSATFSEQSATFLPGKMCCFPQRGVPLPQVWNGFAWIFWVLVGYNVMSDKYYITPISPLHHRHKKVCGPLKKIPEVAEW